MACGYCLLKNIRCLSQVRAQLYLSRGVVRAFHTNPAVSDLRREASRVVYAVNKKQTMSMLMKKRTTLTAGSMNLNLKLNCDGLL